MVRKLIFRIVVLCSLTYAEESVTIGFWNVENLFDLKNDPGHF